MEYIVPGPISDQFNSEPSNDFEYFNYTISHPCVDNTSYVNEITENVVDRQKSRPAHNLSTLPSKINDNKSFSIKVDISIVDDEAKKHILTQKVKDIANMCWAFVLLIATIFSLIFILISIFVDINKMSATQELLWGIGFYAFLFLFCCGITYIVKYDRGGGRFL